uniref:Uncharacterized protein n=1 Tax=Arundo donax TaxID=35708 RepID=A0A0A9CWZ2_ARUDO
MNNAFSCWEQTLNSSHTFYYFPGAHLAFAAEVAKQAPTEVEEDEDEDDDEGVEAASSIAVASCGGKGLFCALPQGVTLTDVMGRLRAEDFVGRPESKLPFQTLSELPHLGGVSSVLRNISAEDSVDGLAALGVKVWRLTAFRFVSPTRF